MVVVVVVVVAVVVAGSSRRSSSRCHSSIGGVVVAGGKIQTEHVNNAFLFFFLYLRSQRKTWSPCVVDEGRGAGLSLLPETSSCEVLGGGGGCGVEAGGGRNRGRA